MTSRALQLSKLRPAALIIAGTWLALYVSDLALCVQYAPRNLLPLSLLALAAALLPLAIKRIRHHPRVTDLFFPLILLNPLFAISTAPLDRTLLGGALLGLLAAAIISLKRDSLPRYISTFILMLLLALVSRSFLLLMPALILWLLYSGILMIRSAEARTRPRGFVVLALAEVGIILFGIACFLEPPAPEITATPAADLFATAVGFADFPLTIAGIVALALAWGRSPTGKTPPWLAGLFALLLAMLTLLITNVQSRKLPPPGADQTMILLCILYTIFSLATARPLRWTLAILLLAAGFAYTFFRPYA